MDVVNIEITQAAKNHIQEALKWKMAVLGEREAKEQIKENINNWRNQLLVAPQSGKLCKYYPSRHFREMVKGDYRYEYEVEKNAQGDTLSLLIFCHVRMDYQTLLRNTGSM